jgi:hypothetical protein
VAAQAGLVDGPRCGADNQADRCRSEHLSQAGGKTRVVPVQGRRHVLMDKRLLVGQGTERNKKLTLSEWTC